MDTNVSKSESLQGILKTMNELFHSKNGIQTAIGYLETIKTFFKEQRTPNDTEIEYYSGIINLVQKMLQEK